MKYSDSVVRCINLGHYNTFDHEEVDIAHRKVTLHLFIVEFELHLITIFSHFILVRD